MAESYVECLVATKPSVLYRTISYILYGLAVLAAVSMVQTSVIGFLAAVLFGFLGYLVSFLVNVEYEYLYLDKELTIDKVLAKSKRKRVNVFSLDKMEIIAPIHSYALDSYKNRQVKVLDYSCGDGEKPDQRYAIFYEGSQKLIISPSEELLKLMYNQAPRKVMMQ